MPGVCDYTVLHQGKLVSGLTLEDPIPFTLASSAVLDVHALLVFKIKVEGGPAKVEVQVNGTEVSRHEFKDGNFCSLVEIISPGMLQHGDNTLRFKLMPIDYVYATISNVALWWFKTID